LIHPSHIILGSGNKRKREAAEEETGHKRYMKDLGILGCPSDLARSFKQSSHEPIFLNHRPLSSSGIPTELLHPIFGEFLDLCQNAEPTVEDFCFVNVLSESMSKYYDKETERAQKFRDCFKDYFHINFPCIEFDDGSRTDGTWFPNPNDNFIGMNAEVKKEPGTGGNPHIQNIAYYKQYLLQNQDRAEKFRLPCFLIQVNGPELSISTAIYGNKITVDPYHYTLSLACPRSRFEDFARIFCALKKAIVLLQQYYDDPTPASQREFPYPNSVRMDDNKEIRFKYHSALGPLVFVVDTLENSQNFPQKLVVKFTQQYPVPLHQHCAKLYIAPEIYGHMRLPGNWYMIVMEYLSDFQTLAECTPNNLIMDTIKNATEQLHSAGYVHGDLRSTNILIHYLNTASLPTVRFVDWDWAGEHGQVKYPISINPAIIRHDSARALGPILKEHDQFMVSQLGFKANI